MNNYKTMIGECMSRIKNDRLKSFGLYLMDKLPEYFYIIPASSSGKYHPSFALGEGGLVRHTVAAVDWYESLCRSFEIPVQDEAIFALVFHDSIKSGLENIGHTVPEHPQLAANFVYDAFEEYNFPEDCGIDIDLIYRLILTHMGIWGDTKPKTQIETIVHLADFCAAQKIHERYFCEVKQ